MAASSMLSETSKNIFVLLKKVSLWRYRKSSPPMFAALSPTPMVTIRISGERRRSSSTSFFAYFFSFTRGGQSDVLLDLSISLEAKAIHVGSPHSPQLVCGRYL